MIKSMSLHALQNEEHSGFCSNVSQYLDEVDSKALNIEFQVTDFKLKLSIQKTVLDLVLKNSYTVLVEEADIKRDRLILGFFKLVRGMLHHFQASVAKAAYNVNLINENFSDITRLSYDKQTQAEESYLTALKQAWDDVKRLGVTEWVGEIEKAHHAFIQQLSQRNKETDSKPNTNMKAARIETDLAYDALVNRINAFITIAGERGQFESLVKQINGRIDQYSTSVAKRKGRGKKGDDAESSTVEE